MNLENISLYRSAFYEAVDAMVITDGSTGKIVDANRACTILLGYDKHELIGQKLFYLLDEESLLEIPKAVDNIKMYGNVLTNRKITTKNGEYIPVDMAINTIKSESGNFVMTSFRDISERIRYEKDILRINSELSETNANKDRLFSIIAHDLKSPMNALIGFSGLVSEEENEIPLEEVKEFAKTINEISKSSYNLLENLLQWAQVQTKNIKVDIQDINLHALGEKILNFYKPASELKKITLVNELIPGIPVKADENMLSTIMRNIVSNSIKFSPEHKKITLSWFVENSFHNIVIADEGIGMDKQLIDNLFKVGVQTSRSGTNKERGTGLGLLLCNEFVKLHGGEINVISEVGKGTKFIVRLPVKPKPAMPEC